MIGMSLQLGKTNSYVPSKSGENFIQVAMHPSDKIHEKQAYNLADLYTKPSLYLQWLKLKTTQGYNIFIKMKICTNNMTWPIAFLKTIHKWIQKSETGKW